MPKLGKTPAAQAGPSQAGPSQSGPWIYNPVLDLTIGCGAWSAPLLLLSYVSLASNVRIWAVIFYALTLFFNYPHYMATIYRAYHRSEDFQKYRIFTVHITALVVLTLFLSHFWMRLLPWIFTIYLTWSPWHYSGQNYGLFMMFARRAGADPDKKLRRALYGAFIVSYLILFLGFNAGPSTDSLFLSLNFPPIITGWEQIILSVAFLGLSGYGIIGLARQTGWRKLVPSVTLLSTQFLWFILPTTLSLIKGVTVPQNRYSSGVLAVMHAAQYLWITSYYARREAKNEAATNGAATIAAAGNTSRDWRPVGYFAILILGGIALFVPGPWVASRAFHYDYTVSFLIFTSLINIHHFILDGAIWKLREGRIAALLLDSRERISDAAANAGGRLADAGRWLVGSTRAARALRVSTACLLLLWGAVDQVRYYLALHTDDLHDLQRAAALNSYDSSLLVRLATQEITDGHPELAEAAYRRAMNSDPADPGPRQALLHFLVDQQRFDEAFQLTDTALKYTPKDASLLIDRGLLAMKLGHPDQAVSSWGQAIEVDPGQTVAHLYMADEQDREGQPEAAAFHYNAFLEKIARKRPEERPSPDKIIAIVLRMADCQTRAFHSELAVKSYHLAEKLAIQTGQNKLEAVADVNEADLQSRVGGMDEALRLYQRALRLDQSTGDSAGAAQDWVTYGHFLETKDFPATLAYACLLKSQSLTPPGTEPESTTSDRQRLEKKLGAEAVAIRRDPEPVLQKVLELRR
jgi:tetratricopeptide (TPR) repeat protein